MAQKEKVKESLENIINNIGEFESGDIDWYSSQITLSEDDEDADNDCRSADQRLMTAAFKYPEFHPLMRKVVELIMETNVKEGEVWDQDEEHAGTNAALLLALENKADVLLYAYFIATNDLNHPVYQEEDWDEVFAKWGECEETLALMIAISLVPGQWFDLDWDSFASYTKEGNNIDAFFRQLHFFIIRSIETDLYLRDNEKFLLETLPEILPDEIAGDEELVAYIANQFLEYPEVPEPPTLEMLKEGYNE